MKIKPNEFNFTVLFNACGVVGSDRAKKIGKKLFDEMPDGYRNNIIVLNSAIDMLMKFSDVQSAEEVFKSMKTKDIFTYGAMMKGNSHEE